MEKKQRIQILLDRLDVLQGKSSKRTRIAGLTARLGELSKKRIEVRSDNSQVQEVVQEIVDPRVQHLYGILEGAELENTSRYESLQKELRTKTNHVLRNVLATTKRGTLTDKKVKQVLAEIARLEGDFAEKLSPLMTKHDLLEAEMSNLRQELESIEVPEVSTISEPEDVTPKLDALERRINQRISQIHTGGNQNRNIQVNGNSSTLSKYTDINFVAGSNIGIVVTADDTRQTTVFTISTLVAGGSGGSYQSVSGTVNATNPTFGYPSAPQAIVGDGVTYFQNNGYTYAASVITMDIPPSQYIKAFV